MEQFKVIVHFVNHYSAVMSPVSANSGYTDLSYFQISNSLMAVPLHISMSGIFTFRVPSATESTTGIVLTESLTRLKSCSLLSNISQNKQLNDYSGK